MDEILESYQHNITEDLLIITDFQNVYLPDKPWACPTIKRSMINTINIIEMEHSLEYVITRYIAPQDPKGAWKNYNKAYYDINSDKSLSDFPDMIKELVTSENVITKDTYSSLKCGQIKSYLKGKKRIILTGVVAECCILSTMMEAIDLGYEVVYLYDCISGCTSANESIIRDLAESFSPIHTKVMNSNEYLQCIKV